VFSMRQELDVIEKYLRFRRCKCKLYHLVIQATGSRLVPVSVETISVVGLDLIPAAFSSKTERRGFQTTLHVCQRERTAGLCDRRLSSQIAGPNPCYYPMSARTYSLPDEAVTIFLCR